MCEGVIKKLYIAIYYLKNQTITKKFTRDTKSIKIKYLIR